MSSMMSSSSLARALLSPSRAIDVPALTFGIEFEFALATRLTPSSPDPHAWDVRTIDVNTSGTPHDTDEAWISVQQRIANTLMQYGIPAFSAMAPQNANLTSANAFTVAADISIRAPDNMYFYYPIEIQSNPLPFSEISLDAIRTVVRVLTHVYRTSPGRHTSNDSTGLHIHIGNGSDGFNAKTTRCLAAILWAFEPQLSLLHPPHRRSTSPHCLPLSRSALGLETGVRERGPPARLDGFERIMRATNGNAVVTMMATPGRGAYNFENLRRPFQEPDPNPKRTVEFRMHEGTLDEERVVYWARFCHGVVRFARDAAEEDVVALVRGYLSGGAGGMGVGQLLGVLGMGDCAVFYGVAVGEGDVEEGEDQMGGSEGE